MTVGEGGNIPHLLIEVKNFHREITLQPETLTVGFEDFFLVLCLQEHPGCRQPSRSSSLCQQSFWFSIPSGPPTLYAHGEDHEATQKM